MTDVPDDSEPTPERQAELRAAYEANVATGKAPYEDVRLFTIIELQRVLHEHDWPGEVASTGDNPADLKCV